MQIFGFPYSHPLTGETHCKLVGWRLVFVVIGVPILAFLGLLVAPLFL